jgi:Putative antitoxin
VVQTQHHSPLGRSDGTVQESRPEVPKARSDLRKLDGANIDDRRKFRSNTGGYNSESRPRYQFTPKTLIKNTFLCVVRATRYQPFPSRTFDFDTQAMHDPCMATKTISIEIDAYELLVRERKDPKESFSRVIRRVLSERPALTAGDLLDAMKAFEGRGAGPRRRRSRDAAA